MFSWCLCRESRRRWGRRCGSSSWVFIPGTALERKESASFRSKRERVSFPCTSGRLSATSSFFQRTWNCRFNVRLSPQGRVLQDEGAVEVREWRAGDEELPPQRIQKPDRSAQQSVAKTKAPFIVFSQLCSRWSCSSVLFWQRGTSTGRTDTTPSSLETTIQDWLCSTTCWWPTACTTLTSVRVQKQLWIYVVQS